MGFDPSTLEGQVAIVTGGGTGIGRGIALEMARVGAKIVIASRSVEHLEPAAKEIRQTGAPCKVVQMDVRDWDACHRMAQEAVNAFGRVDILVNNAAGNFRVPAEELTQNGWQSVIGIDLNGTWNCSRAVFPVMKQQQHGNIVNILAFTDRGAPSMVHAASAKGGILTMTMTLAAEWGPYGIRVNAITPGRVPTLGTQRNLRLGLRRGEEDDLGGEEGVAQMQGTADDSPVGRTGSPADIGNAAVFLCSDLASWITGVHLHVDGGRRLGTGGLPADTPLRRPAGS
ncbi:MAG: SDR family oxidoreductase [Chloroflexi bacterium]|nr:SDR family oxidoreductase [Chloroflexota bacterium]